MPNINKILLSIHPEYAFAILGGLKGFEFRRVPPKRLPAIIYLYATAPVKKIVGTCHGISLITLPPAELWEFCRFGAGIGANEFYKYFEGCELAHAIKVTPRDRFKKPLTLSELKYDITRPPQSFQYLD